MRAALRERQREDHLENGRHCGSSRNDRVQIGGGGGGWDDEVFGLVWQDAGEESCEDGTAGMASGWSRSVVRDEIAPGTLVVPHRLPEIRESFHALTASRRFPNPLIGELIEAMKAEGMKAARKPQRS